MRTIVLDDPKARDAMREAQHRPVRVDVPGEGHGFMVSEKTLQLIRQQLKRALKDNTRAIGEAAANSGFSETDIKDIFPDDAGE